MMNKFLVSLLGLLVVVSSGCSSSSQADTVDTSTKVLASNIVIDNTNTRLSSTNLQTAIEELAPASLSNSVIVGTWNVTNYPDSPPGKVTFSPDGSYSVTSGAFRIAGVLIDAPYTGKWKIIEGASIELTCDIPDANPAGNIGYSPQKYPIIHFAKSKIIFQDGVRVSVLERTL